MSSILIIGSGAREHAFAKTFLRTSDINHIFISPGNDGMISDKISLINMNLKSQKAIQFCKDNNINLVVVGSEKYLVDGITDFFQSHGILCFGPDRNAAKIEGSKLFFKQVMKEENIRTAEFTEMKSKSDLEFFLKNNTFSDYVIKSSGLAGGKGVILPETYEEAVDNTVVHQHFGNEYFLEKKLFGTEVSIMAFCNGKRFFNASISRL